MPFSAHFEAKNGVYTEGFTINALFKPSCLVMSLMDYEAPADGAPTNKKR